MISKEKKSRVSVPSQNDPLIAETVASVQHSPSAEKNAPPSAISEKNTASDHTETVVSAIVFNDPNESADRVNDTTVSTATIGKPVVASVFSDDSSALAFNTRLRNVIQYTFECLRDSVAHAKPTDSLLLRSIAEMKSLSEQAKQRFNPELTRRMNELIEETEAFVQGEKSALTHDDDHQGVLHYRHYVRIAWLSHFILGDLGGPFV